MENSDNFGDLGKTIAWLIDKLGPPGIQASGLIGNGILDLIGRLVEALGNAASTTDPAQFVFLIAVGIITINYLVTTPPYNKIIDKLKLTGLLNLLGVIGANHAGQFGAGETVFNLPNGITFTITPTSPFGIAVGPTAPRQPPGNVSSTGTVTSASGGAINTVNGQGPFLTGNQIIDLTGTPFNTQWDATLAALGFATVSSAGSLFGAQVSPIVEQGADGLFYVTNAKVPNLSTPGVAVDLSGPLNDYPGVRGWYNNNQNNPAVKTSNIKWDGKYHIIGYVGVVT